MNDIPPFCVLSVLLPSFFVFFCSVCVSLFCCCVGSRRICGLRETCFALSSRNRGCMRKTFLASSLAWMTWPSVAASSDPAAWKRWEEVVETFPSLLCTHLSDCSRFIRFRSDAFPLLSLQAWSADQISPNHIISKYVTIMKISTDTTWTNDRMVVKKSWMFNYENQEMTLFRSD